VARIQPKRTEEERQQLKPNDPPTHALCFDDNDEKEPKT
jgi:hypothetical protein